MEELRTNPFSRNTDTVDTGTLSTRIQRTLCQGFLNDVRQVHSKHPDRIENIASLNFSFSSMLRTGERKNADLIVIGVGRNRQ